MRLKSFIAAYIFNIKNPKSNGFDAGDNSESPPFCSTEDFIICPNIFYDLPTDISKIMLSQSGRFKCGNYPVPLIFTLLKGCIEYSINIESVLAFTITFSSCISSRINPNSSL